MLLHEILENSSILSPNKTALIFNNRRISYIELDHWANSLAHALIEKGIKRQDRVVIYLENSIEVIVAIFASLKADAVFSVINPQVKATQLDYIISDCQAKALITDKAHFNTIIETFRTNRYPEFLVLTDVEVRDLPQVEREVWSYRDLIARYSSNQLKNQCIDLDLASLIYTSGSTGKPKGVMLTHLNMVTAATSIIKYLENTSDDIIIDFLPLSFDYGLYQVLMSFKFGGTIVLEKSFGYPYKIIDLIIKNKVSGLPLVPTVAAILLTLKNLEQLSFSHLRYITSTGQVLPPAHIARLREIFPTTRIFSMYGLTECKRVSYLPPEELSRRPASVGKAIPNTEVYLVDKYDYEITESQRSGELVVRGSTVMRGYWGQPELSDRVLRPGRFSGERVLYTGDIFEKDEDGFLYFLGRKDDMFKSGSELVSPREIENVLCDCPGVLEVAVIGVDDEILGKAIKAFIVPVGETKLTQTAVIKYCSEHLMHSMVPKYIELLPSLPKTTTGKIKKSVLR